jgi:hypothetical protein
VSWLSELTQQVSTVGHVMGFGALVVYYPEWQMQNRPCVVGHDPDDPSQRYYAHVIDRETAYEFPPFPEFPDDSDDRFVPVPPPRDDPAHTRAAIFSTLEPGTYRVFRVGSSEPGLADQLVTVFRGAVAEVYTYPR